MDNKIHTVIDALQRTLSGVNQEMKTAEATLDQV
jgi:hypothetical protein